jgi:hypothetical protein
VRLVNTITSKVRSRFMALQAFSREEQFSLLFKYPLIPQDWLVKIDQILISANHQIVGAIEAWSRA